MPLETVPQLPHQDYSLDLHHHVSVTEWELCEESYQTAMDWDAWAEQQAEAAAERFYEQGTPELWAEEERDRMIDALGYGPPPGW